MDDATVKRRSLLMCDSKGQILWMSEGVRRRLDPADSLLQSIPAPARGQASRFLASASESSVTVPFQPGEGGAPIVVRFSRVPLRPDRLLLLAEARERSGDLDAPPESSLEMLGDIEQNLIRNYFRLQQRAGRLHPKPRRGRGAAAIWTAQLEQLRASIGRELHVGAGQALAAIRLHLDVIRDLLPEAPDAVRGGLERIAGLADDALAQVRAVAHRLHPPDWQSLTLHEALENLWSGSGLPARYQTELRLAPLRAEPPLEHRIVIYRAVQEAISNIIRHAGCTRVSLSLEQTDGRLALTVEDDGRGFDAKTVIESKPLPGAGIGLRAMRRQVLGLGGEFSVVSGSKGTKLAISLPV